MLLFRATISISVSKLRNTTTPLTQKQNNIVSCVMIIVSGLVKNLRAESGRTWLGLVGRIHDLNLLFIGYFTSLTQGRHEIIRCLLEF